MANLITLAQYKANQGLNKPDDDARIEEWITSISQLVKTYCGTSFIDYYVTPYVEEFTISFKKKGLVLTEGPVVNVVSVEERTNYGEDYVLLDAAEKDYYVDLNTDIVYRTTSTGWKYWPIGPAAVKITYTSGYATVPEDLKLAIYDLITYYRKEEHKEQKQLGSASMNMPGTSTIPRNADFPDHIKRVLDLYKQLHV